MRGIHKEGKTWDTMTLIEREECIRQVEECVRQYENKELLLLFCLMQETGIRMGGILELRPENVQGRELLVVERKFGGTEYYRNPDGSLPVISEGTAELLIPGEDGKFFHHDKGYYAMVLRKAFPNKEFSFRYLRRYILDVRLQEILNKN